MPIDAQELARLLDRYWSVLVTWVGGPHDEAEDIVQAAFIKMAAEDPIPINRIAWLFTVTKRLAINERLSRNKRRSRESQVATQQATPVSSPSQSTVLELQELLSKLVEHECEIVVARIWGELTFDEIADVFGEPKTTVWRIYQSGIAGLRELYGSESDE